MAAKKIRRAVESAIRGGGSGLRARHRSVDGAKLSGVRPLHPGSIEFWGGAVAGQQSAGAGDLELVAESRPGPRGKCRAAAPGRNFLHAGEAVGSAALHRRASRNIPEPVARPFRGYLDGAMGLPDRSLDRDFKSGTDLPFVFERILAGVLAGP